MLKVNQVFPLTPDEREVLMCIAQEFELDYESLERSPDIHKVCQRLALVDKILAYDYQLRNFVDV